MEEKSLPGKYEKFESGGSLARGRYRKTWSQLIKKNNIRHEN